MSGHYFRELLDRIIATEGRHVDPMVFADPDAVTRIVSYPRCGRTWLRVMAGYALVHHYGLPDEKLLDITWLTRMAGLPPATFDHDDTFFRLELPYTELTWDKTPFADRRVLFQVRDVYDVLVSTYFYTNRRLKFPTGDIGAFIRDPRWGAHKVLTHYHIWHAARDVPLAFDVLHYEDMAGQPHAALTSALAFLGVTGVAPEVIDQAVRFGSFDNMLTMSKEGRYNKFILGAGNPEDPESYKVRKGKVGGFTDYLSDADIGYIDACIAELGNPFARPPGLGGGAS